MIVKDQIASAGPAFLTLGRGAGTQWFMEADELQVTARMARLSLSPDEEKTVRQAVDRLLAYCAQLAKADVAGLEPTTHPLVRENRLRSDEPQASELSEALVAAAPETEDRFILIPNVL